MAMVVKNNMSAVRTLNTLNTNSSALQKSLAKVSSGMKINSAQDDASGYAISERMRVQIRSLDQANQNTQNASSLMKTAEGAVSSTIEILKSLKEKAINAATDTNTDQDRATIQKELDQFIDQIDDNALTTFNGKFLVDGSKTQQGKATFTSITNQNLDKETTGSTELTALKNRSGESLEIRTTDSVTASFVMDGKTYTTTFKVDDNKLEDIFKRLNDEYNVKNNYVNMEDSATAYAVANDGNNKITPTETSTTIGEVTVAVAQGVNNAVSEASVTGSTKETSIAAKHHSYAVKTDSLGKADAFGFAIDSIKNENDAGTVDSATGLTNGVVYAGVNSSGTSVNTTSQVNTVAADGTSSANSATTVSLVSAGKQIGVQSSMDRQDTANGETGVTVTAKRTGINNQISGLTISITDSEGNVKKAANAALDAFKTQIYAKNQSDDNAMTFHTGAAANQAITVGLQDMRSEALGLKGTDGSKVSVATQDKANAAVSVFDNAIQKALDQQATIGAIEARLEYTSNNLTTSSENVQAAESTIRDADMAKEMTNYTKNNVLLQAAQSMLAQANQNSSAVLSLLQ